MHTNTCKNNKSIFYKMVDNKIYHYLIMLCWIKWLLNWDTHLTRSRLKKGRVVKWVYAICTKYPPVISVEVQNMIYLPAIICSKYLMLNVENYLVHASLCVGLVDYIYRWSIIIGSLEYQNIWKITAQYMFILSPLKAVKYCLKLYNTWY